MEVTVRCFYSCCTTSDMGGMRHTETGHVLSVRLRYLRILKQSMVVVRISLFLAMCDFFS